MNPISELIAKAMDLAGGPVAFADALSSHLGCKKLSYQAIRKWQHRGVLPRTEWTGETRYAEGIEYITGGKVTAAQLLERRPAGTRPPGVSLAVAAAHAAPASVARRSGDRRRTAPVAK